MSDDEADPELLELLRQSLGISNKQTDEVSDDTGVLRDAEYIYNNAIDISIDMYGTKAAAAEIYRDMQLKSYSPSNWSEHELHPKPSEGFGEVEILNFVFTMDLLNFQFWSNLSQEDRFQVEYRGKRWTGYNSLVACLRRALDDGIPITTPRFWRSRHCSGDVLKTVFRSATAEPMPMLRERIQILKDASEVLFQTFATEDELDLEDEDDDDALEVNNREDALQISLLAGGTEQVDESNDALVDDQTGPPNEQPGIQDEKDASVGGSPVAVSSDAQPPRSMSDPRSFLTDAAILLRDAAITSGAKSRATDGEDMLQTHLHGLEPSHIDAGATVPSQTNDRPEIESGSGRINESLSTTETASEPLDLPSESKIPVSHGNTSSVRSRADARQDHTVVRLVQKAGCSAGRLVNLLAKHFECFRDGTRFDGRRVRILKRAQIFVADLWAALSGRGLGEFQDIDHLTMFADYRVPQCLHSLGVLIYSPPLEYHIRSLKHLESGHSWEVQLRGCSIWAVELLRREILKTHADATHVNAILIDFFLYDLAKERENKAVEGIPHHRTQSIWY